MTECSLDIIASVLTLEVGNVCSALVHMYSEDPCSIGQWPAYLFLGKE